jgi:hypothetical protein
LHQKTGQRSKRPVADVQAVDAHKAVNAHKTSAFASGENARLDELIALLGCTSEIASFDGDAFLRRAGEVIARAVSSPREPKKKVPRSPTAKIRALAKQTRDKRKPVKSHARRQPAHLLRRGVATCTKPA